jgi:hypothetical protein
MDTQPLARHGIDIVHPPAGLDDHHGVILLRIVYYVLGRRYRYRTVMQSGEKARQTPDQEKEYQPGHKQEHPKGYRIE